MKIGFFSTKNYDRSFFDKVNKSYGFSITYHDISLNEKTAELAKNYDIISLFVHDCVTKTVIDKLVSYGVKLIVLRCSGFNNIDITYAKDKIFVSHVPSYSPHAVAEFTIGLIISLNRKIHRAYLRSIEHNFSIDGLIGFDMVGKTVGIIGLGKIGKIVSQILKGFGMKILAFDPFPDHNFIREEEIKLVELEELYSKSDIITLHCPLTDQNYHMINHKSISKMKNGVMIINTGRGRLIDTKDLITNLKSKKICSVGLDVYEEEIKYFHQDCSSQIIQDELLTQILSFPNVLITSHQAFFTKEALLHIAQTTLENIDLFSKNKELNYVLCEKIES